MGDNWQIRHESLIDQQIRAAEARGEFDNLPGAGKPLTGLDKPYSEDWWLRQLAEREHLGRHALPPSLALRKEAQDLRSGIVPARSERAVRDAVADYNERIVEARRKPLSGPQVVLEELDADEVVRAWRARRDDAGKRADAAPNRKRQAG